MKRLFAMLWDAIACVIAACPFVLLIAPPAYAYVDPSIMTYTVQAVAGVAVTLSAVLGVALRRTRKVIFRILKIDENANKVTEAPVEALSADEDKASAQLEGARESALHDKTFLKNGPKPRKLDWPRRLWRALLASSFFVLTVFVVTPLEIVSGSSDSLVFGFFNVLPLVLGTGVVMIVILTLMLSMVRGKAFGILLMLVFILGFGSYMQALLLNESLPAADGSALNLSEHLGITIFDSIAWVALIAGALALIVKKRVIGQAIALTLSACLILIQGIALASIGFEEASDLAAKGPRTFVSSEGLYEVSAEDNVIVFVLDFFDTRVLERVLDEDPGSLDEFTGFTYFKNSTGSMIPTSHAMPFLLTGELPHPDDTYESYTDERYSRSTFITDIAKQGYSIGIYSNALYTNSLNDYVVNLVPAYDLSLDQSKLLGSLEKMALYREAPWLLKPLFWFYTNEVNQSALDDSMNPYVTDDFAYDEELVSNGLMINDEEKSFRLIHLNGAHYPYTMDAEGHEAEGETAIEEQAHGSLMIVSRYLQQLKDMGLYDDATIIVTSDHGNFVLSEYGLYEPVSPILLIKPSETAKQASAPLKTSNVPTGHLDFHATIMDAIGGDADAYGTPAFEVTYGDRPRRYWTLLSTSYSHIAWLEYEINGHVLDFDNWELTGNRIDFYD